MQAWSNAFFDEPSTAAFLPSSAPSSTELSHYSRRVKAGMRSRARGGHIIVGRRALYIACIGYV